MKKINYCLIFLLFASCSTPQKKEQPKWIFVNHDTPNEIYGSGISFTFDDAKRIALQSISSKIVTTISHHSSVQIATTNIGSNLEYRKNIKDETQDLIIHNFEIVKQEEYNQKVFLLLKVSKQDINNTYKQKLTNLFKKFKNLYSQAIKSTTFYQKQSYLNKILSKKKQANNYFLILKSLNENFNSQKYLNKLNLYNNEYNNIVKKIVIIINTKENPVIVNEVKKYLLSKSIVIADQKNRSSNNFYMKFKITEVKDKIYDNFLSKYKIELRLFDKNNHQHKSIDINFTGNSQLSRKEALEQALINLREKLNKLKLVEYFNLEVSLTKK